MADSNIRLLNNGRAPLNKKGDLVTQAQVEAFVTQFANTVILPEMIKIVEHYMSQIPGLTARMIGDAFAANGLTFHGPGASTATAETGQVSENPEEIPDLSPTDGESSDSTTTVGEP